MKDNLINLYSMCFDDTREYINYFFNNKYSRNNTLIASNGKDIISALYLVNKKIILRGRVLSCPYIVGAGTHPDYRNKGIMNDLIYDSFIKLKKRGSTLTALYPMRHSFYKNQGFMTINRMNRRIICFQKTNYIYREAVTDDAASLNKYYDKFIKEYDCYLARTNKDFIDKINEVKAGSGKTVIAYNSDNRIEGYVMYDNSEIIEIIGKTDFLAGIKALENREYLIYDNSGDAYAMLRIINPEKLLTKLIYPKQLNYSVSLAIHDDFFPDNSSVFKLEIYDGKAEIHPAASAEISLSIEELTLLISGAYDREGYHPPSLLREIFPPSKVYIYEKY